LILIFPFCSNWILSMQTFFAAKHQTEMHSRSLLLNRDPLSALKLTILQVSRFQFRILLLQYLGFSKRHHEFVAATAYLVDV